MGQRLVDIGRRIGAVARRLQRLDRAFQGRDLGLLVAEPRFVVGKAVEMRLGEPARHAFRDADRVRALDSGHVTSMTNLYRRSRSGRGLMGGRRAVRGSGATLFAGDADHGRGADEGGDYRRNRANILGQELFHASPLSRDGESSAR